MGRISPLLCPPHPTRPSPPINLPLPPPLILPPIRPLTEGPSFPLALIMEFLQIIWFILVTGRAEVKLVKPVHFCHFNSYCMRRREMMWQENTCLWWYCSKAQGMLITPATVCLFTFCYLHTLSATCLVCTSLCADRLVLLRSFSSHIEMRLWQWEDGQQMKGRLTTEWK